MAVTPNNYLANGTGEFVGKDLVFYVVDYVNAVNSSTGKDGAQDQVRKVLGNYGTIVGIGPLYDTNTQQIFVFEGTPGNAGATAVATAMTSAVQALGTVDSVDLSSATVTLTTLIK